jgi:hypothetical protein
MTTLPAGTELPRSADSGDAAATQRDIVEALRQPAAYGPGCTDVEAIETHISHVFLAGRFAYKIKKALRQRSTSTSCRSSR